MVSSAMVTIPQQSIDSGWRLLRHLQKSGLPLDGLFWAEFSDGDWRLFVVSSDTSRKVLETVFDYLPDPQDKEAVIREALSFMDISVIRPESDIARGARDWARRRYRTPDGSVADDERIVRRVSLTPSDAYIYYLAPEK